MGWWTRARQVVATVLPPVAEPSAPAWHPPPSWYGDQLRTQAQRQRMWHRHVERQAREVREEQERRRLADEAFRRALERQPTRAYFPPAEPIDHPGLERLFAAIHDMRRRH